MNKVNGKFEKKYQKRWSETESRKTQTVGVKGNTQSRSLYVKSPGTLYGEIPKAEKLINRQNETDGNLNWELKKSDAVAATRQKRYTDKKLPEGVPQNLEYTENMRDMQNSIIENVEGQLLEYERKFGGNSVLYSQEYYDLCDRLDYEKKLQKTYNKQYQSRKNMAEKLGDNSRIMADYILELTNTDLQYSEVTYTDFLKYKVNTQLKKVQDLENKLLEYEQNLGGNTVLYDREYYDLYDSIVVEEKQLDEYRKEYNASKEFKAQKEETPLSAAEYRVQLERLNTEAEDAVSARREYERGFGGNMSMYDFDEYDPLVEKEDSLDKAIKETGNKLYMSEGREKYENTEILYADDFDLYKEAAEDTKGKGLTWQFINGDAEKRGTMLLDYGRTNINLAALEHMTGTEIESYNYFYNKFGKKEADNYIEYLLYQLNERNQEEIRKNASDSMPDNKFLATAKSVLTAVPPKLLSPVGGIDIAFQQLHKDLTGSTKPVDYNRGAQVFYNISRGTREGGEKKFETQVGKFMYNLALSLAEDAAVRGLNLLGIPVGDWLLYSTEATEAVQISHECGAADEQAIAMGLIVGAVKEVCDKAPLDEVISWFKNPSPQIFSDILENTVVDFAGEGGKSLCNSAAIGICDLFVLSDASEFMQNVDMYTENGYSEEEAKKLAVDELLSGMVLDALDSGMSGGIKGTSEEIKKYRGKTQSESPAPGARNAGVKSGMTEKTTRGTPIERTRSMTAGEILVRADENSLSGLTDAERNAVRVYKNSIGSLKRLKRERAEQDNIYRSSVVGTSEGRSTAVSARGRIDKIDARIAEAARALRTAENGRVLKGIIRKIAGV